MRAEKVLESDVFHERHFFEKGVEIYVAFHEVADLYSDFVVDHRTLYNVVGMYVFLLCVSSVR